MSINQRKPKGRSGIKKGGKRKVQDEPSWSKIHNEDVISTVGPTVTCIEFICFFQKTTTDLFPNKISFGLHSSGPEPPSVTPPVDTEVHWTRNQGIQLSVLRLHLSPTSCRTVGTRFGHSVIKPRSRPKLGPYDSRKTTSLTFSTDE